MRRRRFPHPQLSLPRQKHALSSSLNDLLFGGILQQFPQEGYLKHHSIAGRSAYCL
jgi:hypothetical protein